MGVRFSIFGFNQQEVCNVRKTIVCNGKEKELRLDLSDLLILRQIADFPNRKGIVKEIVNGEIFYWMSYKQVLSELPILNIKKQAFVDRVDKLVSLGLVYRVYLDKDGHNNMTYLRIGDLYETLLYSDTGGYSSQLQEGTVVNYKRGCCSQLQVINNNKDNIRRENSISAKAPRNTFTPPTFYEVRDYCLERNNNVDAMKFVDYYTSNGWMVGRNKMKDWKAAVRTWERNNTQRSGQSGVRQPESNMAFMRRQMEEIEREWAEEDMRQQNQDIDEQ